MIIHCHCAQSTCNQQVNSNGVEFCSIKDKHCSTQELIKYLLLYSGWAIFEEESFTQALQK